jgi:hypothetical protein
VEKIGKERFYFLFFIFFFRKNMNLLQSLPGAWIDDDTKMEEKNLIKANEIDVLKQTIETLRKEKERLEETNHIVKKSIEIVAEKRLLAEQAKSDRRLEDYIIISNQERGPTQEELLAAGLEGWEWISTVC